MVHSSTLAVTADSKHQTCGGFTLNKSIRLRSLELIVDRFGSLSFKDFTS
jgi:hypothetical protein